MVTTKGIAAPADPWDAPWVTAAVRASYARMTRSDAPIPLLDDDGEPAAPITRRSASAAERAILDATGATVDASIRPGASESDEASDIDAARRVIDADPFAWTDESADDPDLAAIEAEAAKQAAAEAREKRNARDRARRLRVHDQRVRRGARPHGPKPRGV